MKFNNAGIFSGIFFSLLFLSVSTANAQKEADIINKLRIALRDGSLDQPEPSFIGKGNFSMADVNFTGSLYYYKPNSRMEMVFQGATFIRFGNDTIEWEYNPFEKRHSITRKDPAVYAKEIHIAQVLDFGSKPLLYYKKLKHELKYKGEQKVDSVQAYVLELTMKDSEMSPITFYINMRTDLIYKSQSGLDIRYYANYKSVENYVYPAFMAYTYPDAGSVTLKFDELAVGRPILDSLFTIPQEAHESQRQFKKTVDSLLNEADSLIETGQYDAAITKFNEVLKLDQNNFEAYNGRGLAKSYNKKYYEAIADLNIALEIEPQGSRAFNNRGLAKFSLGDKKGALEDYTEALTIDSLFVISYKNRGLLHLRESRYREAKSDFSRAIVLRPSDADAHFKLGYANAQLGLYADALTSYSKALELQFATEEFYNYKGVTEYKLEKYTEAASSFREAMKKNADNLQYVENLGNTLYKLKNYTEAETVFERYLEKDAKKDAIHNMIGLCKYREEEFKGAIDRFTKAIELNNKVSVYFQNRGDSKTEIEDYEGAIIDYTQAISLNANDADIFYKRGIVKIRSSKKLEGCLDLGTALDMKHEGAKDAIMKHCN